MDNREFLQDLLRQISWGICSDAPKDRLHAAKALARMRYKGEAYLIDCAAQALAELGCLDDVISVFGEDEEAHRLLAAWTVGYLREQAVPFVDKIASCVEAHPTEALIALVAVGESAEPHVLGALKHDNERVVLATIHAFDSQLANWPPPVTEKEVMALVGCTTDARVEVAEAAFSALDSLAAGHRHVLDRLRHLAPSLPTGAQSRVREIVREYEGQED